LRGLFLENTMNDLQRHRGEFARYLNNHQWERTDDGDVFFPVARAIAHGMYMHGVFRNGELVDGWQYDPNLWPDEGINYALDVAVNGATQITAWYFALYSGAVSPAANWTAATWVAIATEITSNTTGYSETTRQAWVGTAAASDATSNLASKAVFTIAVPSSTLTVNGCAMVSSSAKGATTGKLYSASKFATTRNLSNGDLFNLGYTLSLTSS
jgi:hypothetical protein